MILWSSSAKGNHYDPHFKELMAMCNKGHALRAVVLIVLFWILYSFMVNHYDNKIKNKFYFSHESSLLQKSLEENSSNSAAEQTNIYTIVYNADNSTVENVIFNLMPDNYSHSNNSALIVDSTDFKGKFFLSNQQLFLNGFNLSNNTNNNSSISNLLRSIIRSLSLSICPEVPPSLEGPSEIDVTIESLERIEKRLSSKLYRGGWHRPKECNPRNKVAIIVPFRDRYAHLPIFLKNLHPFLMKQQIEYGIFVIEQTNGKPFNRAALLNVGFLEALKLYAWDCFIFHDIDLLPLDDRNLYTCPDQPRHMSVAINIFGFKLPYSSIFGGVSAMTTSQFKTVNGFSNSFWGWGGEDDDMSNRLKHANFHISRYPINIARYMMLNHQKEKANPKRYENLANGAKKFNSDGLNSIKYEIYNTRKFPLFTWFLVELKIPDHS